MMRWILWCHSYLNRKSNKPLDFEKAIYTPWTDALIDEVTKIVDEYITQKGQRKLAFSIIVNN